jgi:hypothetical protein
MKPAIKPLPYFTVGERAVVEGLLEEFAIYNGSEGLITGGLRERDVMVGQVKHRKTNYTVLFEDGNSYAVPARALRKCYRGKHAGSWSDLAIIFKPRGLRE